MPSQNGGGLMIILLVVAIIVIIGATVWYISAQTKTVVVPPSQIPAPQQTSPAPTFTPQQTSPAPTFTPQPAPTFTPEPAPAPFEFVPAPTFTPEPAPTPFEFVPAPTFTPEPAPAPFEFVPAPTFTPEPAPAPSDPFINLQTLTFPFVVEPDTSQNGSTNRIYCPTKGEIQYWLISVGGYKHIRISGTNNIMFITKTGTYNFYGYFVDPYGRKMTQSPYPAWNSIGSIDLGNYAYTPPSPPPAPVSSPLTNTVNKTPMLTPENPTFIYTWWSPGKELYPETFSLRLARWSTPNSGVQLVLPSDIGKCVFVNDPNGYGLYLTRFEPSPDNAFYGYFININTGERIYSKDPMKTLSITQFVIGDPVNPIIHKSVSELGTFVPLTTYIQRLSVTFDTVSNRLVIQFINSNSNTITSAIPELTAGKIFSVSDTTFYRITQTAFFTNNNIFTCFVENVDQYLLPVLNPDNSNRSVTINGNIKVLSIGVFTSPSPAIV